MKRTRCSLNEARTLAVARWFATPEIVLPDNHQAANLFLGGVAETPRQPLARPFFDADDHGGVRRGRIGLCRCDRNARKESQLVEAALAADDRFLGQRRARHEQQLASDDVFLDTAVARDQNTADLGSRTRVQREAHVDDVGILTFVDFGGHQGAAKTLVSEQYAEAGLVLSNGVGVVGAAGAELQLIDPACGVDAHSRDVLVEVIATSRASVRPPSSMAAAIRSPWSSGLNDTLEESRAPAENPSADTSSGSTAGPAAIAEW